MNIHIHTHTYGCIIRKYTYGLYINMYDRKPGNSKKKKHIPLKCQNYHVKIWGNNKCPGQGRPSTQRCMMLRPAGPPCPPGEPAGTYPPLRVGVRPKSVQSPTDMSSELSTVTTAARARPLNTSTDVFLFNPKALHGLLPHLVTQGWFHSC